MTSAYAVTRRPRAGMPTGLWLGIALALPFVGAVTVTGIYLNQEAIVAAAWVSMCIAASVLVEPLIGVVAMTATFLLVAYPTVLQTLGVLTVNNLLGLCLGLALAAYVVTSRDLSFLTVRQVLILAAIGVLFVLSNAHADVIFPTMGASQGLGVKGKLLDRTSDMMHDFFARFVFLVFLVVFVRRRRDVNAVFGTFVLVLFLAVPSALINWWQGTLSHGFRAMASITAGANANRLAMICLMEVACWWCWVRAGRGAVRWPVAMTAIGGAFLVVLATGSRSGLIGCGVLGILLQTGPRRFRAPLLHLGAAALAGAVAIVTVVPPEAWQRMLVFSQEDPHAVGASSLMLRETTIETGMKMIADHPFLGVGLGNYREVSRQVYLDEFFRPPHNSVIWAASEGGVFVLAGYLLLFAITWRDLNRITQLADRDPALAHIVASLRMIFVLYCFFALLADLCLNPITYVLIGLVVTMRRYLEGLPAAVPRPALATAR
ncbi:MAG TPA: O-antigen ligase family protein [Candidatus Binatus sp.]|nr:O-antigen ligase family protein [Candidatus Binatus sp.]